MRCGSVGLIILAAACFVIATVAVAVPYWGQFRNRVGKFGQNEGVIWVSVYYLLIGSICSPRNRTFRTMDDLQRYRLWEEDVWKSYRYVQTGM